VINTGLTRSSRVLNVSQSSTCFHAFAVTCLNERASVRVYMPGLVLFARGLTGPRSPMRQTAGQCDQLVSRTASSVRGSTMRGRPGREWSSQSRERERERETGVRGGDGRYVGRRKEKGGRGQQSLEGGGHDATRYHDSLLS